ncbi:hypothetical protein P3G55_08785 [Leptospira sp. 96542]|nr:hypothetical protein [Leptospira sp. 96542]
MGKMFFCRFCLILSSYFLFFGTMLVAADRTHGWVPNSGSSKLFVRGVEVLNSRDGFRFKSPEKMTSISEIDYYLMLGELYIKTQDKVGIANVLYDLRTKKGEYSFADALLTSLWKQSQGDDVQAIKTLDIYIQKEPNTYFRNLAKNMRTNLYQGGEDEKKSMIRMDCIKTKPYYSLCRVFRLQYYIDLPSGKEKDMHKHFVNIMRVSSPFFEDPNLEWIPLFDRIDEDLPTKLAFLGFVREAIYFQNMMMDFEKVSDGNVSENSTERLAFFQVLAGEYTNAEESLLNFLRITKQKKTSILNRIYVKLGALAYIKKEYKKSLEYYLKLDLNNWSSDIHHPFLNEPMSITGVKTLISVTVYKVTGAESALKALQKIQDPEKLSEDDIWPKLRIAQMLLDQNPELSSRIADEVIYMAQGKGWRRLEYAATILQGYNQIYRKEIRKSTIEFTKSRGILDAENAFFQSEFIRNFGFVFAHTASGKKGPITANIREGVNDYLNDYLYEDLFYIRNFRPFSFSTDQFFDYATNHLKEDGDVSGLFETIYKYNLVKTGNQNREKPHALFQIPYINDQFRFFSGFQTQRESKFFDSTYADSREMESGNQKKSEAESIRNLENSKLPVIVLLPYKESYYLFLLNPKESKKNNFVWKEIKTSRPDNSDILDLTKEFVAQTKDFDSYLLYWNEPGLVLGKWLKKEFKDLPLVYFHSLVSNSELPKNTKYYTWKCPTNIQKFASKNLNFLDTAYFEGTRILKDKDRVHIWDFPLSSKRDGVWSGLAWGCSSKETGADPDEISIQKLTRRIDYRTVPKVLFYSEKTLGKNLLDSVSLHTQWIQFWFRSGTKRIFYQPQGLTMETITNQTLFEPSNYKDDGIVIQAGL